MIPRRATPCAKRLSIINRRQLYRGQVINWDPQMLTALSDVEVEYREEEGKLWHVRYPFVDERGNELDDGVVIATTRPETIPADVAIAVHPDDERWQPHLGRHVRLPLRGFDRLIPLVADTGVDLEFGTGALKITPGHDQLDFEIGERHGLEPIRVVDWDGTLTAEAGLYAGMDRDEARTLVAQHLEEDGYCKTERNITMSDTRSVQAMLTARLDQWFVDTNNAAVAQGVRRTRRSSLRLQEVFCRDNIRPWCISRQLWWGHRIPAWYCSVCDADAIITGDDGEITIDEGSHPIVELTDPTACPTCGGSELVQDPDVLDTWFSSGLWTHSTLGWPNTTDDLSRFYPSSVMETGYDILFFWVARMIMLGCYNIGEAPFHTVYLHGLVRDAEGRKMSKSLDNVIDPLEKADQYGMDALPFTRPLNPRQTKCATRKAGGLRNFPTARTDQVVLGEISAQNQTGAPDFLPLQGKAEGGGSLPETAGSLATPGSHHRRRTRPSTSRRGGRRSGLSGEFSIGTQLQGLRNGDLTSCPSTKVLDDGLRLLHPWMPFITEAIWQQLRPHLVDAADVDALIGARYPQPGDANRDLEAEAEFSAVQDVVTAVRQVRADYRVQAGQFVEVYVRPQEDVAGAVSASAPIVEVLSRARPLAIVRDRAEAPTEQIASAVLPTAEIILPLGGLVDLDQERARLNKDLDNIVKRLKGAEAKLANEGFRAKAPAACSNDGTRSRHQPTDDLESRSALGPTVRHEVS